MKKISLFLISFLIINPLYCNQPLDKEKNKKQTPSQPKPYMYEPYVKPYYYL